MKTRTGFVSNSSSTSFVVLIPEKFSIESIDWSEYFLSSDEGDTSDQLRVAAAQKEVIECLSYLQQGDSVWFGGLKCDESYDVLEQILKPYTLTSFDASSDSGEFIGILYDDVKRIINL